MSVNPETLLLSAVLTTKDMSPAIEAGITQQHFTAHEDEWAFLLSFWQEYGETPSKPLFRARYPRVTVTKADDLQYAIGNLVAHSRSLSLNTGLREANEALRLGDYDGATSILQQRLRDAGESISDGSTIDLTSVHDDLLNTVMERHEMAQSGKATGITTGWPSVDTRTGGVQDGHLWIVGARLGTGKTWALIHMAAEAIKAGKKVLFVSLEMPYREVAFRVHSLIAQSFGYNVRSYSLSSGKGVDVLEYRQFLIDFPSLVPGEFIINDNRRGKVTPMTLAGQIERVDPDVAFVDYLTLLGASDGKRATDDWRVAAGISSEVKDVAHRLEKPIVAASQLNRGAAGGTQHPGVETISQSDNIGMDADAVLTMAKYGGQSVRRLEMVKYRHGPDGFHWFTKFNPDEPDGFEELPYSEVQDYLDLMEDDEE